MNKFAKLFELGEEQLLLYLDSKSSSTTLSMKFMYENRISTLEFPYDSMEAAIVMFSSIGEEQAEQLLKEAKDMVAAKLYPEARKM